MTYEYGVAFRGEPHRWGWGMTEEQAYKWVEEFEADGGIAGAFFVIKRRLGEWEKHEP
jgi:hypothetical protein